jgi:saccharopine dehydrogenase (NAD+, L-lysine-forming)
MKLKQIFIRAETYPNECRTPLTPKDVCFMSILGFEVYVQSSISRCYPDADYASASAVITSRPWYEFQDALILGIKELNDLDKLDNHMHAYFSHSFKGQQGSAVILDAFRKSNSFLYDIEYLTSAEGKRLIAFGFHAGLVGGALGIIQHAFGLGPLTPWKTLDAMITDTRKARLALPPLQIGIVGADGRTGKGIQRLLDILGLQYTKICRNDELESTYDILYNAIALDETYDTVWFEEGTYFHKKLTIVDISCDYTRPNNPIQLYDKPTSWEKPVHTINDRVGLISIENLPSLLPIESSDHFSDKLCELLLSFDTNDTWERALTVFKHQSLVTAQSAQPILESSA